MQKMIFCMTAHMRAALAPSRISGFAGLFDKAVLHFSVMQQQVIQKYYHTFLFF
ncbi:MAG TPA: hypothetical protein H9698_00860 [Candidatus Ruthenibacterium merdavium]|uniref:Uncharacterized protein n=1 Tax=Candidatus Ruthenibacterium merdavium TaxID=2838752 RepID=A0A9D2Q4G7_9FIRM|nr:hypothetical protein [Candidatus Ruthenibacterium merdavium]